MFQDVRHAWRSLCRAPEFTVTVVLTLALGIGVNGVIFSVVNAALWRPLPYPDANSLVMVWEVRQMDEGGVSAKAELNDRWPLDDQNLPQYRKANRSFSVLGGYVRRFVNLTGAGEPERSTPRW